MPLARFESLLETHRKTIQEVIDDFPVRFEQRLALYPERAAFARHASAGLCGRMSHRMRTHLEDALWANPDSAARCERLGHAHHLHAVPEYWVITAYEWLRRDLLERLNSAEMADEDRAALQTILCSRLEAEHERFHHAYQRAQNALSGALLRVLRAAEEADSEAALIDALTTLVPQVPGIDQYWLGNPDEGSSPESTLPKGEFRLLATHPAAQTCQPRSDRSMGPLEDPQVPIWVSDWNETHPSLPDAMANSPPWRSVARLPLGGPRRVVMLLSSQTLGFFGRTVSVGALCHLATSLRLSLERVNQGDRNQRLQSLYNALLSGENLVLHTPSERRLLHGMCLRLTESGLFQAAWIGKPGEDGVFNVLSAAGVGAADLHQLRILATDTNHIPLVARAWADGRIHYNNDHITDPHLEPWLDFLHRHRWRAAAAIPMHRDKRLWAVLCVVAEDPGIFDQELLHLIARIGRLVGHGLDEFDTKFALEQARTQALHLAYHDALTGLPNRLALSNHLPKVLARAHRAQTLAAICLLDLDDFKPINDHFGHDAGDALLRALAKGVQTALREADFACRLGGDEFVFVYEGLHDWHGIETVLAKLRTVVETPVTLPGGESVVVHGSLGLTLFPLDDGSPEQLLRHADLALYKAKEEKRARQNWYRLYESAWTHQIPESADEGVGGFSWSGNLIVHYQPVVDLLTGEIREVEALARLTSRAGGLLYPGEFLPALNLQETQHLSLAVCDAALGQCKAWQSQGIDLKVSINLSPGDLRDAHLPDHLRALLDRHGVAARHLIVEVPRSVLAEAGEGPLKGLRRLGVGIAIDDLESGDAGILRLDGMGADIGKMTQAIVPAIASQPERLRGILALCRLASQMGLRLVAKGAESGRWVEVFRALGISHLQGHACSRPVPPDEVPDLLHHPFCPSTTSAQEPAHTWLAAYAALLVHEETLALALRQIPGLARVEALADSRRCPLHPLLASDPLLAATHERYHRELAAAVPLDAATGENAWGQVNRSLRALYDRVADLVQQEPTQSAKTG